jgi:hypothetical protein
MAVETAPVKPLDQAALEGRRLAVENVIGTLRIEDMEPDETTMQILIRYRNGEIDLPEANKLIDDYSRTIR